MLPLFVSSNVSDASVSEGNPWEFRDPRLEDIRKMPKQKRREIMQLASTDWQVYSTISGRLRSEIIGKDNPPEVMHGIAIDYDRNYTAEQVIAALEGELPEEHLPNYIEISLGMNIRLVWLFERPIPTPGLPFAERVMRELHAKLKAHELLRGYDEASVKPTERWTNGGEWFSLNDKPLPWKFVLGTAIDVSDHIDFDVASDVPLAVVRAEVDRRWPGRWKGNFEVGETGVRFWDPSADNPTGCQIKTDGMLVFTRPGFLRWGDILGNQWVEEQRIMNLAKVAENVFCDSKNYFIRSERGRWDVQPIERVSRYFKNHGITALTRKGSTASDLEKVLHYVETANRVESAGPILHRPDGLLVLDNGERVLNVSTIRALSPAEGAPSPEKFPWIDFFLRNLFAREEARPFEHYMAWLRRAYSSFLDQKPLKGQAVFVCGPHDNGKNLLSDLIVKPLLGGKAANPYDVFVGASTFTDDILGAPLLAINDEEAPAGRSRAIFLQKIKSFVVNTDFTYHPKFAPKSSIEWSGRLHVTLNDTPKDVGILPEVNGNTYDKLMFFGTQPYKKTFPSRWELKEIVGRELPHFARWLLDGFEAPADIVLPGRMGVRSYHDEHILNLSKQQEASYNLLELLITWVQVINPEDEELHKEPHWVGTPTQLFAMLSVVDPLKEILRTWDVRSMAQDLTSLARQGGFGIEALSHGTQTRTFKIDKTQLINFRDSIYGLLEEQELV